MENPLKCPSCGYIEEDPFVARLMVKGGYVPIIYRCHQDLLFVMAPEEEPSVLVGTDGAPLKVDTKIGRYINVERLPEELKDLVMNYVRSKGAKNS